MSGPIVRKYGFPNFEKIFGKREIQHGATLESPVETSQDQAAKSTSADHGSPPGANATEGEKQSEDSAQL